MKAIFTAVCLLALAFPLLAQQAESALDASLRAWASSKIESLEFERATFDQAFAKIKEEWQKQHPDLSLPLAVATYNPDTGSNPMITMSLKRVPFAEALDYIGDASRLRLSKDSNFPRVDLGGRCNYDDLVTLTYPMIPETFAKLGLAKGDSSEKVAAAYARFGVELKPWMTIVLSDQIVILRADKEQHELVAGINRLLEKGFAITQPAKK